MSQTVKYARRRALGDPDRNPGARRAGQHYGTNIPRVWDHTQGPDGYRVMEREATTRGAVA